MLDDDALRVRNGVLGSFLQLLAVVYGLDADARTRVGGLHNHGVAQLLLHALDGCRLAVEPLLVREPNIVNHGDAALREHHLHRDLVHTVCRCQYVATRVGYARHLDRTLERAILTVRAVQRRQDHVERSHYVRAKHRLTHAVEVVVAIDGTQIHLLALRQQTIHILVVLALAQPLARVPVALLGDIYRGDVVLCRVDGLHRLNCCQHRDLVLDRAAAEDYANVDFRLHILSLFIVSI